MDVFVFVESKFRFFMFCLCISNQFKLIQFRCSFPHFVRRSTSVCDWPTRMYTIGVRQLYVREECHNRNTYHLEMQSKGFSHTHIPTHSSGNSIRTKTNSIISNHLFILGKPTVSSQNHDRSGRWWRTYCQAHNRSPQSYCWNETTQTFSQTIEKINANDTIVPRWWIPSVWLEVFFCILLFFQLNVRFLHSSDRLKM